MQAASIHITVPKGIPPNESGLRAVGMTASRYVGSMLEEKFREADPQSSLQGAWIVTDIQQEEHELERAFTGLDTSKVHFAVLGDAQSDVGLLTRREEDRGFILRLFGAVETRRFQFKRAC